MSNDTILFIDLDCIWWKHHQTALDEGPKVAHANTLADVRSLAKSHKHVVVAADSIKTNEYDPEMLTKLTKRDENGNYIFTLGVENINTLMELNGLVGKEVDFMYEPAKDNFGRINHVPVFYGSRENAGHTATVFHPGGGEYANVASNWLRYVFKGDDEAGEMFVGADCSLCTNSNWETMSKGLD